MAHFYGGFLFSSWKNDLESNLSYLSDFLLIQNSLRFPKEFGLAAQIVASFLLTNYADFVAQQAPMGFDRYVVWVKDADFDSIRTQIPHLPEKLTTILAFSLSTINKVASFISEGDIIDIPGIDYLFILAGDIKYNQKS